MMAGNAMGVEHKRRSEEPQGPRRGNTAICNREARGAHYKLSTEGDTIWPRKLHIVGFRVGTRGVWRTDLIGP